MRRPRIWGVPHQVVRLYSMLLVEIAMAQRQPDEYALGRYGGYAFTLEAMEAYWPALKPYGEEFKRTLDAEEGDR